MKYIPKAMLLIYFNRSYNRPQGAYPYCWIEQDFCYKALFYNIVTLTGYEFLLTLDKSLHIMLGNVLFLWKLI